MNSVAQFLRKNNVVRLYISLFFLVYRKISVVLMPPDILLNIYLPQFGQKTNYFYFGSVYCHGLYNPLIWFRPFMFVFYIKLQLTKRNMLRVKLKPDIGFYKWALLWF